MNLCMSGQQKWFYPIIVTLTAKCILEFDPDLFNYLVRHSPVDMVISFPHANAIQIQILLDDLHDPLHFWRSITCLFCNLSVNYWTTGRPNNAIFSLISSFKLSDQRCQYFHLQTRIFLSLFSCYKHTPEHIELCPKSKKETRMKKKIDFHIDGILRTPQRYRELATQD